MGAEAKKSGRMWRNAYRTPDFAVESVDLDIVLDLPVTRVTATLSVRRLGASDTLNLDGGDQKLASIAIDGETLDPGRWRRTASGIEIVDMPDACALTLVTQLRAGDNPGLEGLNHKDGIFFTHCEPEGFRRITFFPDRPDIFARYRCRIEADRKLYPILLSNGTVEDRGDLPGGRHYAIWRDPHPKASYVFALVAGDFAVLADRFTTRSGREVTIGIHAHADELDQCRFGLSVLKKAMRWDEETYGLEYDLDTFNVAVIRSYPGGAMENKGLNIYTSEFFLASEKLVTDDNMQRVRAMVAHEYFHNWTGNRVGLQSWFELSLKEGFTIYRQQQFMAMSAGDEGVARIDDVERLREVQFPEDDGGFAHAVRPESYAEISNFYNATVYEKGAEIIRMLRSIVGDVAFLAGVSAFFARHDGSGARIDDLIDAVEAQWAGDLSAFRGWYDATGAVRVDVSHGQAASGEHSLTFRQTRDDGIGFPLPVPVRLGFVDPRGQALGFRRGGENGSEREALLLLDAPEECFTFFDLPPDAVPSVFRGFSAPVRSRIALSDRDLGVLAHCDGDPVARWEAMQRLGERAIADQGTARSLWLDILGGTFTGAEASPALAARLVALPGVRGLLQRSDAAAIGALAMARTTLAKTVARLHAPRLRALVEGLRERARDPDAIALRRLRGACGRYLSYTAEDIDIAAAWRDWEEDATVETAAAAMRFLIAIGGEVRERIVEAAYARWCDTPLLLDLWFVRQAEDEAPDSATRFAALARHPDFALDNGSRVKTAFDAFTFNPLALHSADGEGYDLIARLVASLNRSDPRLAARFLKRLGDWRRFDPGRRARMQALFTGVLEIADLAPNLREIAESSLAVSDRA